MKLIIPVQTVDGLLDTSNVAEAQPPESAEWLSATAYDFGDEVAVVLGTNAATITHGIYKSQVEGIGTNTGNDPTTQGTDVTKWKLTNATARWRMFNNVLQQQTTKDSIIGNVDLPGASGDGASQLDSILNSVLGDIDLKAKIQPNDWTPDANMRIISKRTGGTAYDFFLTTDGTFDFFSAPSLTKSSTAAPGFTTGTAHHVRVTRKASTGDVTFYTSENGVNWDRLGDVVSGDSGALADASGIVSIGIFSDLSGSPFTGNIKTAQIYSGLDPDTQILVSDFNVDRDYVSGSTMNSPLTAIDLPGASGDYGSTPDSAANRITGDIDIRVRVSLSDWTPSVDNTIVAKYGSGANRSFLFTLDSSKKLQVVVYPNGLNGTLYDSTIAPVVSDGEIIWIRFTLDVDDGFGDSVGIFYTSTDITNNPNDVIWDQLGDVVNSGGTVSIFPGTAAFEIGSILLGTTSRLTGNVYSSAIYNGIDGTLVLDFNPFRDYVSGNTMTSSTTGEVYTANGNAKFVGQWTANGNAAFIAGIPGIVVEVIPGVSTNAVAFMNIDATSVTVVMTDPVDGEVFNQTFNVLSLLGIDDWWPWLFKPIERDINLVVFGLPTYINATIKATIASPDTAKCGQMVLGVEYDMGFSQYDAAYGIKNYSQKNVDEDTGAVTITAGAFKSVGDINVVIESNRFSAVLNTLTGLRNTPVVWVAEGSVSGTIQYGFFNTFDLVYSNFTFANCLLTIEGL